MSITTSRLLLTGKILSDYDGSVPLHHYLKGFFRKNPKMGSTDRRISSALVYGYFRLGNALPSDDLRGRMIASLLLFNEVKPRIRLGIINELGVTVSDPDILTAGNTDELIAEVARCVPHFDTDKIFDHDIRLSGGLSNKDLGFRMLDKPLVYIRVRNGFLEEVISELDQKEYVHTVIPDVENAISLADNYQLYELKSFRKGLFEVQDLSSQLAGNIVDADMQDILWDCCCGAGGKSLQVADNHPEVTIIGTDKRGSSLRNFRERLIRHGHMEIRTHKIDLLDSEIPAEVAEKCTKVIADVPCTGSGTWGRNPENLAFFSRDKLNHYLHLQRSIIESISRTVKKGTLVYYMTCSAFEDENESNIQHFQDTFGFQLLRSTFIGAERQKCDLMYCAEMRV